MNDDQLVWRYMNLGHFVWLLRQHRLWLSRADQLGDPWEVALSDDDVASLRGQSGVGARGLAAIMEIERTRTYVNCWSAAEYESNALWQIYCDPREGISIQTTLGKLRLAVLQGQRACHPDFAGELEVRPVSYEPRSIHEPAFIKDFATRKRPMFRYEQEVRIVFFRQDTRPQPLGRPFPFAPEDFIECVWVHPSADESFKDVVTGIVSLLAPSLSPAVRWSSMRLAPTM